MTERCHPCPGESCIACDDEPAQPHAAIVGVYREQAAAPDGLRDIDTEDAEWHRNHPTQPQCHYRRSAAPDGLDRIAELERRVRLGQQVVDEIERQRPGDAFLREFVREWNRAPTPSHPATSETP